MKEAQSEGPVVESECSCWSGLGFPGKANLHTSCGVDLYRVSNVLIDRRRLKHERSSGFTTCPILLRTAKTTRLTCRFRTACGRCCIPTGRGPVWRLLCDAVCMIFPRVRMCVGLSVQGMRRCTDAQNPNMHAELGRATMSGNTFCSHSGLALKIPRPEAQTQT